jgi:hypothetical protein
MENENETLKYIIIELDSALMPPPFTYLLSFKEYKISLMKKNITLGEGKHAKRVKHVIRAFKYLI